MAVFFLNISAALDGHLNTMASKPPIAWENSGYSPAKGTLYARPTNLQGQTFAETENDRTNGVYQIDIFAPSGEGKNEAVVMSDLIADRFKQDTEITYSGTTVRINNVSKTSVSTVGGSGVLANTEQGWYQITIEVVYYSFTPRRT